MNLDFSVEERKRSCLPSLPYIVHASTLVPPKLCMCFSAVFDSLFSYSKFLPNYLLIIIIKKKKKELSHSLDLDYFLLI